MPVPHCAAPRRSLSPTDRPRRARWPARGTRHGTQAALPGLPTHPSAPGRRCPRNTTPPSGGAPDPPAPTPEMHQTWGTIAPPHARRQSTPTASRSARSPASSGTDAPTRAMPERTRGIARLVAPPAGNPIPSPARPDQSHPHRLARGAPKARPDGGAGGPSLPDPGRTGCSETHVALGAFPTHHHASFNAPSHR